MSLVTPYPYALMPTLRDLLSGSSMRLYRSLTFEESIDIFSLVTPFSQESIDILPHLLLRRPPLWVFIYLTLPVFLQVPGVRNTSIWFTFFPLFYPFSPLFSLF